MHCGCSGFIWRFPPYAESHRENLCCRVITLVNLTGPVHYVQAGTAACGFGQSNRIGKIRPLPTLVHFQCDNHVDQELYVCVCCLSDNSKQHVCMRVIASQKLTAHLIYLFHLYSWCTLRTECPVAEMKRILAAMGTHVDPRNIDRWRDGMAISANPYWRHHLTTSTDCHDRLFRGVHYCLH